MANPHERYRRLLGVTKQPVVHKPLYSVGIIEVSPREAHVISGEELAKLKARRIMPMTDDGCGRGGGLDDYFLNTPDASRHRLQDLTIQRAAMHDEIVKVGGIELHNAGRLERLHARHRWRSEEQRYFAEVVAGPVEQELALQSAH
jgi:hypothetical protein